MYFLCKTDIIRIVGTMRQNIRAHVYLLIYSVNVGLEDRL